MRRIQSYKHIMGTYEINKISVSCFDDKRFVLNDGIHTLAYLKKNRFLQIMTNKKDSKRFSQMVKNKNKRVHIKTRQVD